MKSLFESPYITLADAARTLRIGVVLGSDSLGVCERHLLADLSAASYIEMAVVAIATDPTMSRSPRFSSACFFRLYDAIDRFINRHVVADAAVSPLADVNLGTASVQIGSIASMLPTLGKMNLDVILCPIRFRGAQHFAACARFGVWWMGSSTAPGFDAGYAGPFLATAANGGPFGAVLWSSMADAGPIPIEYGSTRRVSGISVIKNQNPLATLRRNLWLAALRVLAVQGWEILRARHARIISTGDTLNAEQAAKPSLASLTRSVFHMSIRHVRHRKSLRTVREQWRVGIRPKRSEVDAISDPAGYRWVEAPAGHWYADPFVFSHNGTDTLFIEDFDESRNLGHIVCGEVAADGSLGEVRTVMHRPYHLSYPHVFEHAGEIFMIPETGFNNTVELYRAVGFPDRWELVKVLYAGPAFDTTVFFEAGQFWFLTSLVEDAGRLSSQLLLFHAKALDGDWTLHPASPISNDARIARAAGGIFRLGSSLVRPAQDCSQTYGGAVRFCRITRLNQKEYAEEEFAAMSAEQIANGVGLHTYNRSNNFEVIDCRLRLTVPVNPRT